MIGRKHEVLYWLEDQPDGIYEANPHHEKRSLNANSYYWRLLTDLAGALRVSRQEMHEIMLRRYGQYLTDADGNLVCVLVDPKTNMTRFDGHYEFDSIEDGLARYRVIKGSHLYTTVEFSHLLNGLVSDCSELGIETLTPGELERLKGYEQAHTGNSNKQTDKRSGV